MQASQIFEPFLDLSLPVYEERSKHTARRGAKSISEDIIPVEDRSGPSKHQLKKAAKNAKKNVSAAVWYSLFLAIKVTFFPHIK